MKGVKMKRFNEFSLESSNPRILESFAAKQHILKRWSLLCPVVGKERERRYPSIREKREEGRIAIRKNNLF